MKYLIISVVILCSCYSKSNNDLEYIIAFQNNFGNKIIIAKINDSLNNLMFYEKLRDSNFTSISFLKSNKFITTLYKYNSNQYIDNFIDTKKIDSKIVFLNKNELIIGETIFHKSKKEKELNFENFKQFKFYPEIRSDNYYYDIDTLSYNKLIPLYDNPISVSNKIMARIGLDIKLPITFSTEYYCYNEFDKFYLVGYNYDETSDSYKSKSFIKEADYKAYFIKLR